MGGIDRAVADSDGDPVSGLAEKRIALLIGNEAYASEIGSRWRSTLTDPTAFRGHFRLGSCDTEAWSAYRRRPTVRVMKESPSGSAIMS
jgi:hypothetical protein